MSHSAALSGSFAKLPPTAHTHTLAPKQTQKEARREGENGRQTEGQNQGSSAVCLRKYRASYSLRAHIRVCVYVCVDQLVLYNGAHNTAFHFKSDGIRMKRSDTVAAGGNRKVAPPAGSHAAHLFSSAKTNLRSLRSPSTTPAWWQWATARAT